MAPKAMAVLLLCVTVAFLLVRQEAVAARELASSSGHGIASGPASVQCCGAEANKVGEKDEIDISIGGGHVSIGGSIHFGEDNPKHAKKGTPSYGQPHP
ncbi:hypothetical protein ACP4OV_001515 [Aristida adscensionis]